MVDYPIVLPLTVISYVEPFEKYVCMTKPLVIVENLPYKYDKLPNKIVINVNGVG